MRKTFLILLFTLSFQLVNAPHAGAVTWPVADYLGRWLTKTTVTIQQAANWIHHTTAPFIKTFEGVQKFFQKAKKVVNGVLKNMRMVEDIVELEKEIRELYGKTVASINAPRDTDGDGVDDFHFLDKWRHVEILLALVKETTGVFEIFSNVIGEGATEMDDKGRIKFIRKVRDDLRKIRSAMRVEIRRINRKIYAFGRLEREVKLYKKLFSAN